VPALLNVSIICHNATLPLNCLCVVSYTALQQRLLALESDKKQGEFRNSFVRTITES
jgi:hypothetical protein